DDRDFSGYRSAGGFYLNLSLKLNALFGGFGFQHPVPPQQMESESLVQNTRQSEPKTSQGQLIKILRQSLARQ
ncbi:MAG: hypothetical protein KME23_29165, partial [Goleter apudmare HA4340-LM2]|nr:hypothetical protein [Goleter apudmare HA4340-LM2]